MYRLLMTGHRSDRASMGVLFTPFRTRAAHVVLFGPIRIENPFLQSPCINDTSCVISDVQMPGMSGVELQSLLIAQGHRMPIIFITAFHEERVRARAMKAGAIGFLNKPFSGQTLIECLETALKRRDRE